MSANGENDQSSLDKMVRAFKHIIEKADEEDYAQCSARALEFITMYPQAKYPQAKLFLPFACYFKLFSEAYRTWQISYNYTPIRSRFDLAYRVLEKQINANNATPDDDAKTLLTGFERLSKMLCANTWCENSFINNDPFALKDNAQAELSFNPFASDRYHTEEQKPVYTSFVSEVEKICDLDSSENYEGCQKEMALWLRKYFHENRLLHEGLHGCAELYIILLQHQRPLTEEEEEALENIENNQLKELRDVSFELYSDLNAHVFHIRKHNERLKLVTNEHANTYLRINKGFLVNKMSVAFEADIVRDLFLNPKSQEKFKDTIISEFDKLGVKTSGFQVEQLHDIFQTSFGEDRLKTISFDLWKEDSGQNKEIKEIKVKILNSTYYFDISVSLSALGVCTLYFKLNIGKLNESDDSNETSLRYTKRGDRVSGLRVEEAQVLQSLICPHAGQAVIADALSRRPMENFQVLERCEFPDLINDIKSLRGELIKPVTEASENLDKALTKIEAVLEMVEQRWTGRAKINEANDDTELNIELSEALGNLNAEADSLGPGFDEFKIKVDNIFDKLAKHQYLAQLAKQYFSRISVALREAIPALSSDLKLATDTGWFTYLYCHSIDVVRADDHEPEIESATFDKIVDHPDMVGFFLEQREARASFDDWRFIKKYDLKEKKLKPFDLQERNLAHIRSHDSDGFFCTEYQAFIYFPDDPMFITAQYETTVELMVRLATVLRYISTKARELSDRIHDELHEGRKVSGVRHLNINLDKIRRLRLDAKQLQTLVARSAVSRYKDHGDLMKRILCEMKLDQLGELLDQQLMLLSDLYGDVLREIEEKRREIAEKRRETERADRETKQLREERREARAKRVFDMLILIVSLAVIHDFAESLFYVEWLRHKFEFLFRATGHEAEGRLTISLIAVLVVFIIYRNWKWKRDKGADEAKDQTLT